MPKMQKKKKMETEEVVTRVIEWINKADSQLQVEGYYANGGQAGQLLWMKNTLLNAPTEELQRELLEHWIGTGALPVELLEE